MIRFDIRFRGPRGGRGLENIAQLPLEEGQPPLETEQGEQNYPLTIDLTPTELHGVIGIPLLFPKFLMPSWNEAQWKTFCEEAIDMIYGSIQEFFIQSTSLSLANMHKKEILADADSIVVDFRGDLFNGVLPIDQGGFKIGIYRKSNDWPVWLDVAPTFDLALQSANTIKQETGITNLVSAGKLTNILEFRGNNYSKFINSDSLIPIVALVSLVVGIIIGLLLCKFLF